METLSDFMIFMATMHKRFNKMMAKALLPYGLNGMHAIYLKAISDNPGITLKELSTTVHCDGAHTSRAIATLTQKKFVCDDRKDASQKKYKLFLTEAGQNAKKDVNQKMDVFHQDTLNILSSEEQKIFLELIQKFLVNFNTDN